MKTHVKNPFLVPALIAAFSLILTGWVTAQTFTTLHSFMATARGPGYYGTNSDGAGPECGLILSDNTLYGTALQGGSSNFGTVFALNTDGTGFTNLYNFNALSHYTNNDGADPHAGLILSSNILYGTTSSGGISGNGTVFAVNTDGTGFTNLHAFTASTGTNSDGISPQSGLILSNGVLYGTAWAGGSSGGGTVFKVNTDGTGFRSLHGFTVPLPPLYTNGDGSQPFASLILSGNTLYGTSRGGGGSAGGTVFAVNTDGTSFTNLHSFSHGSDGASPVAGLIISGNTLYGTAGAGGSSGNGTIFSLSFAPQLTITPSGTNVVLTWPTNVAGFDYTGYTLQSTTNLVSPAVWTDVSPKPVVADGQNAVTNPISGAQQFFRLIQPVVPPGMALIPAGAFTMGNSIGDYDVTGANPTNVTVSAFYMDTNLVSYSQWQSVYNWATNTGYGFAHAGSGKAANHPVQTVDWYDTVKWSNARSQQAGMTPVYYTDAGMTQIYTNRETDAIFPNWSANGYRLPTEAEWEKAARGGLSGQRFPWGNTISESQANYYGNTAYSYNLGPNGYNAIGRSGGTPPATSPVGSFVPNGYGLYDMCGNVFEWCWDCYGTPYAGGSDPRGPAYNPSSGRVLRGGSWLTWVAHYARCADRLNYNPSFADNYYGFRCVRGL